ncbi:MAG: hypothetical protein WKF43_02760 [Acidimicrobiales bacterium]
MLGAAWFGLDRTDANIAPIAFCVAFWVGGQISVALLGDVWWAVNSYTSITALLRFPERTGRPAPGHWTAALTLFSFVWLELAHFDGCANVRVNDIWIMGTAW